MNDTADEAAGSAPPGERLRAARERAGMSVGQVADQLRLAPQVIEALERGDHQSIGAQVFVRGYLRRYAEVVGESPVLAERAARGQSWADPAADLTSTRLRALDGTGDRLALGRWPLVVVAVLLCLGAVYWWAQRASAPRSRSTPAELVQEQVVHPPAAGEEGVAANAPPAAASPAPALPAPASPALAAAASPVPAARGSSSAAPAAGGARKQLRLSFHAESWTELYDASGARLYWGLGEPGDSQAVSGTPPFRLILGHPDGVTVSLEGTALALPAPRGGTTLRTAIDGRGAFVPIR